MQEIFVFMDDSGKLTNNDICCCYGGVVFLDKKEKDKFITQYKQIINNIKCNYCDKDINNCNKNCPEIKNYTLKDNAKKRWIKNYINKYKTFCVVVKNKNVYSYIINNKASKGRFIDYIQKIIIKEIFIHLIKNKDINPNENIKLNLYIDEQTTKSNGYYNLKNSIIEEFRYGISNYNYGAKYNAILHNNFDVNIIYVDSKKNYAVQAADFMAGEARSKYINFIQDKTNCLDELYKEYDVTKFFP